MKKVLVLMILAMMSVSVFAEETNEALDGAVVCQAEEGKSSVIDVKNEVEESSETTVE